MNAFWREEPLTEVEARLLALCLEAHANSAMRNNSSSVAVAQSAVASGDFTKSIIAGLSMLGGMHAPLLETYLFLSDMCLPTKSLKVPGWGNSFEKGHPDPLWENVNACLKESFTEIHSRICEITDSLHKAGKVIYPNPSCFTAAVGIAVKLPPPILPWLFIVGRLTSWSQVILQQVILQQFCADKSCHTSKGNN